MNKKLIFAIIILLLAVASGVFFWQKKHQSASNRNQYQTPAENKKGQENDLTPSKLYENYDLGFGFLYPKTFEIQEIDDKPGFTVWVQNSGNHESFQVYSIPFDEPGPITPERIKKDLPNTVIDNPQNAIIGADKDITALIFFGHSDSIEKTREIWFVSGGRLFQVTTYADLDSFIAEIMKTWRSL